MSLPAYAQHVPRAFLVRLHCDGCYRGGPRTVLARLERDDDARLHQRPEDPYYGHYAYCLRCGHRNYYSRKWWSVR
jgi:hypothetical protein